MIKKLTIEAGVSNGGEGRGYKDARALPEKGSVPHEKIEKRRLYSRRGVGELPFSLLKKF